MIAFGQILLLLWFPTFIVLPKKSTKDCRVQSLHGVLPLVLIFLARSSGYTGGCSGGPSAFVGLISATPTARNTLQVTAPALGKR